MPDETFTEWQNMQNMLRAARMQTAAYVHSLRDADQADMTTAQLDATQKRKRADMLGRDFARSV